MKSKPKRWVGRRRQAGSSEVPACAHCPGKLAEIIDLLLWQHHDRARSGGCEWRGQAQQNSRNADADQHRDVLLQERAHVRGDGLAQRTPHRRRSRRRRGAFEVEVRVGRGRRREGNRDHADEGEDNCAQAAQAPRGRAGSGRRNKLLEERRGAPRGHHRRHGAALDPEGLRAPTQPTSVQGRFFLCTWRAGTPCTTGMSPASATGWPGTTMAPTGCDPRRLCCMRCVWGSDARGREAERGRTTAKS